DSGSLAVPISKWRYTCKESQLTISPSNLSASRSARSLFPEPVGPATATKGRPVASACMLCGEFAVKPRYTIKRWFSSLRGMPHGRKESRVMIRSAKTLLLAVSLGCLMFGQTPAETPKPDNKAGAYYNFAMGRVYAELAQAYGNKPDYLTKAIQHYQEALKLDPGASLVFEELTDLYIQTNHLRDA